MPTSRPAVRTTVDQPRKAGTSREPGRSWAGVIVGSMPMWAVSRATNRPSTASPWATAGNHDVRSGASSRAIIGAADDGPPATRAKWGRNSEDRERMRSTSDGANPPTFMGKGVTPASGGV